MSQEDWRPKVRRRAMAIAVLTEDASPYRDDARGAASQIEALCRGILGIVTQGSEGDPVVRWLEHMRPPPVENQSARIIVEVDRGLPGAPSPSVWWVDPIPIAPPTFEIRSSLRIGVAVPTGKAGRVVVGIHRSDRPLMARHERDVDPDGPPWVIFDLLPPGPKKSPRTGPSPARSSSSASRRNHDRQRRALALVDAGARPIVALPLALLGPRLLARRGPCPVAAPAVFLYGPRQATCRRASTRRSDRGGSA